VQADPGQLGQVLLNLAANARDAMPMGGKLTIETTTVDLDQTYCDHHPRVTPGRYVMLAVSDTGCGMDQETQARIFEPFFTTKAVGEGTGLGLATVYGIVKQSDGDIWVYSEPGQGTTFKIYLPEFAAEPWLATDPAADVPSPRGSETVLVVEDEDGVRHLVLHQLEAAGYVVLVASNPGEARRVLENHHGPIDLLLTDIVMPGGSGHTLAQEITARRPETNVLYMSGYTPDVAVRHGILASTMAYLQKPFTTGALLKEVRTILDRSRAVGR
jgi:CheY-like chemotaxis protein